MSESDASAYRPGWKKKLLWAVLTLCLFVGIGGGLIATWRMTPSTQPLGANPAQATQAVQLRVAAQGQVFWNEEALSLPELEQRLQTMRQQGRTDGLILHVQGGDRANERDTLVAVMVIFKRTHVGMDHLRFEPSTAAAP